MNWNLDLLSLALGTLLGYWIGWHRGVLRLRMFPKIGGGSKPTTRIATSRGTGAPSPTTSAGARGSDADDGGPSSGESDVVVSAEEAPTSPMVTPEKRRQIRDDLRARFPGADRATLDAAVEEVTKAAGQLFSRRAG